MVNSTRTVGVPSTDIRKFWVVVILINTIACTEVAITETVQDVEMKCFIRNVVNGVKNVIEHVKNVDNWVKQTSIWPVVRQVDVQIGKTVLTGVCSKFVNPAICSGVVNKFIH